MPQEPHVRKQLVVNKSMQTSIVLAISWPAATCILLSGLILVAYCIRMGFEAAEADLPLPSLPMVITSAVAFLALTTVAMLYNALRFSHRIAGPAHRIQLTLKEFMAGDHEVRARLRQDDHLQELAESVNRFLDWSAKNALDSTVMVSMVNLDPDHHDDLLVRARAEEPERGSRVPT